MERHEHDTLRDAVTKACGDAAYLDYRDPIWQAISGAFDWQNCWPVIDGRGHITGEVSEGVPGLLATPDYEAMIWRAQAQLHHWEIDEEEGTARMPLVTKE